MMARAGRGTLTIGIPTDINTLDPHIGPEVNSLNVAYSTMEALLRLDAQGNIKPQLAESWEVVDNTTYVFRLRKNVKFSNGEPFNGKAVEYSWKRSQEKHRANKTNWATVSRIDHLDDHTIRIVTEKPDPVSQDLLIGQAEKLEQFHWFIRAHLESTSGRLATAGAGTETEAAHAASAATS